MFFYLKFVCFIIDDFRVYLAWDGKWKSQRQKGENETNSIYIYVLEMDANEKLIYHIICRMR